MKVSHQFFNFFHLIALGLLGGCSGIPKINEGVQAEVDSAVAYTYLLSLDTFALPASMPADTPESCEFVLLEREPAPYNLDEIMQRIGFPSGIRDTDRGSKIVVRILIDEEGKYIKHIVLQDPHPVLTQAVEQHLPGLLFTPAIQHSKRVKAWVTIPFQFCDLR